MKNILTSNLDFFGGNWEKRRIFWIGNGAEYWILVIGRKGLGSMDTELNTAVYYICISQFFSDSQSNKR